MTTSDARDSALSSIGPHRNSAHAIALMATGSSVLTHSRSLASSGESRTRARIRKLVSRWTTPLLSGDCASTSRAVPASPGFPTRRRSPDPMRANPANGRAHSADRRLSEGSAPLPIGWRGARLRTWTCSIASPSLRVAARSRCRGNRSISRSMWPYPPSMAIWLHGSTTLLASDVTPSVVYSSRRAEVAVEGERQGIVEPGAGHGAVRDVSGVEDRKPARSPSVVEEGAE